jgi:hypothetical protein
MSDSLQKRVKASRKKLATMPPSGDPKRRPVVVVARDGRRRPFVAERYEILPVGSKIQLDGYDDATIVADVDTAIATKRRSTSKRSKNPRWVGPVVVVGGIVGLSVLTLYMLKRHAHLSLPKGR